MHIAIFVCPDLVCVLDTFFTQVFLVDPVHQQHHFTKLFPSDLKWIQAGITLAQIVFQIKKHIIYGNGSSVCAAISQFFDSAKDFLT